jgi:DNA-binding PadR family transcriptional regulator
VSSFWTADQAQIYRTLERLKKDGFVSATRRRQAGRPDRRLFEITASGEAALQRLVGESAGLPPNRDPSLIQLYFSAVLDDETLLKILSSHRDEHQSRLERLRAHAVTLAQSGDETRSAVLRQTALGGAMASERCLVDWLDDCLESIGQGDLPKNSDPVGQRHLLGS